MSRNTVGVELPGASTFDDARLFDHEKGGRCRRRRRHEHGTRKTRQQKLETGGKRLTGDEQQGQ